MIQKIWGHYGKCRDRGQEEKGTTEDEMAGWHHGLDAHEFGWTLGVGDEQGGLACCDSWGCKESDTIERLNWAELNWLRRKTNPAWLLLYEVSKIFKHTEAERRMVVSRGWGERGNGKRWFIMDKVLTGADKKVLELDDNGSGTM